MLEMWKKRYSVDDTRTLPHGHAKESCRLIRDVLQSTLQCTFNKGPGLWAGADELCMDQSVYFVLKHLDWGNVQGTIFPSRESAEEEFRTSLGGKFASMLTNRSFETIRYYGYKSDGVINDFREWMSLQL